MEFGLSIPNPSGVSLSQAIDDRIELHRFAQDYGYTFAFVTHHWISYPRLFLEPWPHMAYMAGKLPGVTVTGFIALPLYNAVEIAEKVATMDHLQKGRFVLIAGIGWRAEEFAAAGLDIRRRVSRFEESITLCKQLWSGEEVTFKGRHFQVEQARMAYTPLQRPHPPIWIGAQSEGAVRRAARMGDAPDIPFQVGYPDLVQLMEAYRDELRNVGKPYPSRMPLLRFVSVDEDGAKAKERARAIEHFFDWYEEKGSETFTKVRLKYSFEEEIALRTVAGTPSEVVEELQKHAEEFGITFFSTHILWPSLEKEAIKRHIAFLGEKVLAPLRAHTTRVSEPAPVR